MRELKGRWEGLWEGLRGEGGNNTRNGRRYNSFTEVNHSFEVSHVTLNYDKTRQYVTILERLRDRSFSTFDLIHNCEKIKFIWLYTGLSTKDCKDDL